MVEPNLCVNIAGVTLENPIIAASGTFGFGFEYAEIFDINSLGAITLKSLTLEKRFGNFAPRVVETPSGMLNAIGLENPGANFFVTNILPRLKKICRAKIIANVAGSSVDEYAEVAEILGNSVDLIELNISCPNVKEGCLAFGSSAKMAAFVTEKTKLRAQVPVIVKLSPNVTDICEIARAVISGGADGLSLINTLVGMKIDIKMRRPILANITGGLSGPAIHPVAVRMVHEVRKITNLPIIGMGGVSSGADAIELMLAGANAVAIGTSGFVNPLLWARAANEIKEYLTRNDIADINDLPKIINNTYR
jgi:dihydroorotate dehydrogenase (NAD+) catalytic subunit